MFARKTPTRSARAFASRSASWVTTSAKSAWHASFSSSSKPKHAPKKSAASPMSCSPTQSSKKRRSSLPKRTNPLPVLLRHVSVRELNDDALKKLSREGHLFLSLAEMKAIQAYYREQSREPTDVELETLAQTWSEHCVHKTLKSGVEVVDESGKVLRKYSNLIKETIFDSTVQLMKKET